MLSVGNGITDDVLQEDLEDTTGLLVDEARDTLDTATTSETTNGLSREQHAVEQLRDERVVYNNTG